MSALVELTTSELAARLGVPNSAVYRLVSALCRERGAANVVAMAGSMSGSVLTPFAVEEITELLTPAVAL